MSLKLAETRQRQLTSFYLNRFQTGCQCRWLPRPSRRYLLQEKCPSKQEEKELERVPTASRYASTDNRRDDPADYYGGEKGTEANESTLRNEADHLQEVLLRAQQRTAQAQAEFTDCVRNYEHEAREVRNAEVAHAEARRDAQLTQAEGNLKTLRDRLQLATDSSGGTEARLQQVEAQA